MTWSVWGAWSPDPAALGLSMVLSSGAFALVLTLAQRAARLIGAAVCSGVAVLVLAGIGAADFTGRMRAETEADLDSVSATIAVLDHPRWTLATVWAVDNSITLTYRPRGPATAERGSEHVLEVASRAGSDYDHSGDPCASSSAVCERGGYGVLLRDSPEADPALFTPWKGGSVRVAAPSWARPAVESELVEARNHLRSATPAERSRLERAAFRALLRHRVPGLAAS